MACTLAECSTAAPPTLNGLSSLITLPSCCSHPAPYELPRVCPPPLAHDAGGACQGGVGPQPLHARPAMPLQHPAGLKSFLPFQGEGAPTRLSLFHNFPNMDPVQKAVINHTFGVAPAPRKRQIITCSLCQIRFNSQNQADAHFQGTKHGRRLRAMESGKVKMESAKVKKVAEGAGGGATRQGAPQEAPEGADEGGGASTGAQPPRRAPPPGAPHGGLRGDPHGGVPPPKAESEEEKAKRLLYCALCKVAVNSQSQLEAHYKGSSRHGEYGNNTTHSFTRESCGRVNTVMRCGVAKGGSEVNTLTRAFRCELCDVVVNSESQLKQHVTSRRHKDKLAGKPPKQKLGPYSRVARKPTHSQHPRPSKLSFPKELATSLNGGYLLAPLHPSSGLASGVAHGKMAFAKEPLKTLGPPGFPGASAHRGRSGGGGVAAARGGGGRLAAPRGVHAAARPPDLHPRPGLPAGAAETGAGASADPARTLRGPVGAGTEASVEPLCVVRNCRRYPSKH
ncbi:unnamed protein product [Lampetra fluviatilis]